MMKYIASVVGTVAIVVLAAAAPGQATSPAPAPSAAPEHAAATTLPVPTMPKDAVTETQLRTLFEVTKVNDNIKRLVHAMLGATRATADPVYPAAMWTEMETEMSKLDFAALMLPSYQKYLSQKDAEAAIDFYRSAAGQHYLASVQSSQEDMRPILQSEGQRLGAAVGKKYSNEIEANKKRLQQERGGDSLPVPAADVPK